MNLAFLAGFSRKGVKGKNNNNMVVIEFSEDETDWVIATDKETAVEFYKKEIGLDDSDLIGYKIIEIDEETLTRHYLIDLDCPEPDEDEQDETYDEGDYSGGYKIKESFIEYIQRKKDTLTELFCTTGW